MSRWGALLALACFRPAAGLAQSADLRPEVVPPDRAYVSRADSADGGTLRWALPGGGRRILRVAFEAAPPGREDIWEAARSALDVWAHIPGSPVRFEVFDELSCDEGSGVHCDAPDVRFRWVGEFPDGKAGSTDWQTGPDGCLQAAIVTLALRHAAGLPMSREFLRLVALHEVGHVLGLPHSEDPSDVMHPGNRNDRLSARDVRSLFEIYRAASPGDGRSSAPSDACGRPKSTPR